MALSFLRALGGLTLVMAGAGCATTDTLTDGSGSSTSSGNDPQGNEDGICLLHNCNSDAECGACSDGRNTCLEAEHRCVACNADTGSGCPDGQYCSSWGNCVEDGLECPTDDHGVPQISCAQNADCAACDPLHQICDPASSTCVACTPSDTSACQSTDICIHNECSAECPTDCSVDNDCAQCGSAAAPAHACNHGICSECSATYACPAGLKCSEQGVCQDVCGTDGDGTCSTNADCDGCGADNGVCHKPINSSVGQCGVSANGCSDLGQGVAVLPEPFDQVTNLCSNDGDCAGVGITFNVGELLRDITGINDIGDANIEYGMNVCASVEVANNSCGVCVPCRVDSDCAPINIDDVAGEAFGPIGSLAAAFLLDQVFGPNEHAVQMYCSTVAGDYGVCAPCPGIIYECGTTTGGGGGGGTGSCDHDVCSAGSALDGSCDSCAADVCAQDAFCCSTEWDQQCINEASDICGQCSGTGTGGGGTGGGGAGGGSGTGGGSNCHDVCVEGAALDTSCSTCAANVCAQDPYCCNTDWDSVCVGYVEDFCGGC